MDIILATWNKSKTNWLAEGFSEIGLRIRGIDKTEIDEAEGIGNTCSENAIIKVRAVGVRKNSIIISEDSILSIDALNRFPGAKTVRWSEGTDDDRSLKLLEKLKNVPDENRGAKFQSALAVLFPDGLEETFSGELKGIISKQMLGKRGEGYQIIFRLPHGGAITNFGSPFAQCGEHRKQAIKKASIRIKDWLAKNYDYE